YYWDSSVNDYVKHLKSVYHYSVIAIDKPIDPDNPNGDFYLYPNPAVDYVYISNLYEESVLTIYTSDGQAVMQKSITNANAPVNVSGLAKGMYIATLKSESGVRTAKFLKK
ncbi:MAG: T9SS type A sorting domain-containing protein, partial [Chlorobi bacterium]|nr:T9SS type A sorting domain-containing protein [Chlorobiota bacterium]